MTKIFAREKWNDAQIELEKDKKYEYLATGIWIDWFIPCNADGFIQPINSVADLIFGRNSKRNPSAKWFQLVGVINKNNNYTVELGAGGTFVAKENGKLWVYANDVDFAYGNNFGYIELTIKLIENS